MAMGPPGTEWRVQPCRRKLPDNILARAVWFVGRAALKSSRNMLPSVGSVYFHLGLKLRILVQNGFAIAPGIVPLLGIAAFQLPRSAPGRGYNNWEISNSASFYASERRISRDDGRRSGVV